MAVRIEYPPVCKTYILLVIPLLYGEDTSWVCRVCESRGSPGHMPRWHAGEYSKSAWLNLPDIFSSVWQSLELCSALFSMLWNNSTKKEFGGLEGRQPVRFEREFNAWHKLLRQL